MSPTASLALAFDILAKDSASRTFDKVGDSADRSGRRVSGFGSSFASLGKTVAVGAAALGVGAIALGKGFYDAAIESAKVTAQTEAVIKSMGGVAGVTANQVAGLAEALSMQTGVDDELIQSGQNVLLTFANVQNVAGNGPKIFDRATKAALDMSVALGTDMSSAAMQLGKALNDPTDGLAKLSRSGIQFTDQQKEQIKAMQEAGDVAGAQAVMLAELERQFGGSAEAQATAGDRLKVVWGNLQETLGEKLLPVIERSATFLANNLPQALDSASSAFASVAGFVSEHQAVFVALAVVIGGSLVAAFTAWAFSAAAAAASTIAAMAPVLAIGAAIAALVAGVIWAYQNWDLFRGAVDAVASFMTTRLWPALQAVAGWITGTLVPTISGIIGAFTDWLSRANDVAGGIKSAFDGVVGFFTSMPGRITSASRGMWDGIKEAFRSAVNWIIRGWNGIEFRIPGFKVGPIGYDGFTLGLLDIPTLHAGGTVTPTGIAPLRSDEVLARLQVGETVFPKGAGMAEQTRSIGQIVVQTSAPPREWIDEFLWQGAGL